MNNTLTNKMLKLKTRPTGAVTSSHFELVEESIPDLEEGQILVKVLYLSFKDAKGNEIRTERALYHLIKVEGYYGSPPKFIWGILTKWSRPWKIYMISNIQLD